VHGSSARADGRGKGLALVQAKLLFKPGDSWAGTDPPGLETPHDFINLILLNFRRAENYEVRKGHEGHSTYHSRALVLVSSKGDSYRNQNAEPKSDSENF